VTVDGRGGRRKSKRTTRNGSKRNICRTKEEKKAIRIPGGKVKTRVGIGPRGKRGSTEMRGRNAGPQDCISPAQIRSAGKRVEERKRVNRPEKNRGAAGARMDVTRLTRKGVGGGGSSGGGKLGEG